MNLEPQDENGIVLMILRDIYDILEQNRTFNFRYNCEVKLQKVFFLLTDSLEIPLTKSWYRYGPYIHNKNVSSEKLVNLPENTDIDDIHAITKAEDTFSEIKKQYRAKLHELVPYVFYQHLQELLAEIYQEYTPEKYKPVYLSNLALQKSFRNASTYAILSRKMVKTAPFLENLSNISSNIANFEDMSFMFDYAEEYISLLEDCLVKMNANGKLSSFHVNLLKSTYESSIWVPITLKISINTLTGLNAKDAKLQQWSKLQNVQSKIESSLTYLDKVLNRDEMIPSAEERTIFFRKQYGNDKDFVNAVANVWKCYK